MKEVLKRHTTLLESFLENLNKNSIIKSKEGKTLIEDKEKADRWQQYVEEYIMIQISLKNWKEKRRLSPKNWVHQ
jgi:hypothetical protein